MVDKKNDSLALNATCNVPISRVEIAEDARNALSAGPRLFHPTIIGHFDDGLPVISVCDYEKLRNHVNFRGDEIATVDFEGYRDYDPKLSIYAVAYISILSTNIALNQEDFFSLSIVSTAKSDDQFPFTELTDPGEVGHYTLEIFPPETRQKSIFAELRPQNDEFKPILRAQVAQLHHDILSLLSNGADLDVLYRWLSA